MFIYFHIEKNNLSHWTAVKETDRYICKIFGCVFWSTVAMFYLSFLTLMQNCLNYYRLTVMLRNWQSNIDNFVLQKNQSINPVHGEDLFDWLDSELATEWPQKAGMGSSRVMRRTAWGIRVLKYEGGPDSATFVAEQARVILMFYLSLWRTGPFLCSGYHISFLDIYSTLDRVESAPRLN